MLCWGRGGHGGGQQAARRGSGLPGWRGVAEHCTPAPLCAAAASPGTGRQSDFIRPHGAGAWEGAGR